MKPLLALLLSAVLTVSCSHSRRHDVAPHESTPYARATDTPPRSAPHNSSRTPRALRRSNPPRTPRAAMPPLGMRWNCPPEPQLLGYATR